MCNYVERVKILYFTLISAVRTVNVRHKMLAEGWELFKEVVNNAGAWDLPQLLRSIRMMTTPPPATPPPKMDVSGVTLSTTAGEERAQDWEGTGLG